ncbi:hypothetical protein [Deinococcus arenicola]|uniref:Uncharacterized protein n=1 Tax=Deinococcus arenicola TaxID=2994950 RepID=A0ABU4DVG7_9DEIO|nr:hypothetical protein [Deinococcus sp. ZS9-10]MDV6376441.1 hypothetical protein [Deinococcus sp. ZS9-10]
MVGWALADAQPADTEDERWRLGVLAGQLQHRRLVARDRESQAQARRDHEAFIAVYEREQAEKNAARDARVSERAEILARHPKAARVASELLALVPARHKAVQMGAAVRVLIRSRGHELIILARPAPATTWTWTPQPAPSDERWRIQHVREAYWRHEALVHLTAKNPTRDSLWQELLDHAAQRPVSVLDEKPIVIPVLRTHGVRVVMRHLAGEAHAWADLYS